MYSKIKVAGHPIHPMLIAWPVLCYTGTLMGFVVHAANGHLFWLNPAIALSVVGVGGAVLAVYVPDWTGPVAGATLGTILPAIGWRTIAAGFFGWTLAQDCHTGIRLAPGQELAEPAVQHHQPPLLMRRRHAA